MTEFELNDVIAGFKGRSFSTLQFAKKLEIKYPDIWESIVKQYGEGGKGAGKPYSAYSRVAHYLDKQANSGQIVKLDYRDAPSEWGSPIIRYWAENKENSGAQDYPDEIKNPGAVIEGAKKTVTVNRYERDASARKACIEKWGVNCFVCGFDFERAYGAIGAGFIHVHHLKPLSEIGEEYELNPVDDLRPLCPNCHAMTHRRVPAISIKEVKELLNYEVTRRLS